MLQCTDERVPAFAMFHFQSYNSCTACNWAGEKYAILVLATEDLRQDLFTDLNPCTAQDQYGALSIWLQEGSKGAGKAVRTAPLRFPLVIPPHQIGHSARRVYHYFSDVFLPHRNRPLEIWIDPRPGFCFFKTFSPD